MQRSPKRGEGVAPRLLPCDGSISRAYDRCSGAAACRASRARAWRRAIHPLRPVGSGRDAGVHAAADVAHDHPAAMHQADDAALDESVCDSHGGDAAHFRRRRKRGNDAHRRYPLLGRPHRAFGANVSLPADVVLRLLLSDCPGDNGAGAALCRALTAMAWTPDQPLIRMRHVHKSFGAVPVLSGISLEVMKGEVIRIIGPSGAGKSTLIRCINALVPIDSGSIQVEG